MPSKSAARVICELDDVPDGDARGFEVEVDAEVDSADVRPVGIIVVRLGQSVVAYRNRCPHRGTPLDWRPDDFLDLAREHLVCATHGALFRLEDGFCVAGPCEGDGLSKVQVEVDAGRVLLSNDPRGQGASSPRRPR